MYPVVESNQVHLLKCFAQFVNVLSVELIKEFLFWGTFQPDIKQQIQMWLYFIKNAYTDSHLQ